MKIVVAVTVHEDDGSRTTLEVSEDQWRYAKDEDRPIKQVRAAVLRRTRETVDKLIERASRG